MGTTTNNGWPTPVATDLVKDGWEAIKDLGDAIDTTLGVYAPSTSGLTLINTTSFSGVTSQSINDVFSATYRAYRIVFNLTNGLADADINLRLRVAGSDASGSDYAWGASGYNITNPAAALFGTTSGTSFYSGQTDAGTNSAIVSIVSDLINPFNALVTTFVGNAFTPNTGGVLFNLNLGGRHSLTTSYTGFSIFSSQANSLTGSVSVYGYNI